MADKENPQDKFKRLSLARLESALNQIRLLANLAGYNYKGTREDKDFVISSLRAAIEELEYRYSGDKGSNDIFTVKGKGKDKVEETEPEQTQPEPETTEPLEDEELRLNLAGVKIEEMLLHEYADQLVARLCEDYQAGNWQVKGDEKGIYIHREIDSLQICLELRGMQLVVTADSTYHPKSMYAYKTITIDSSRSPEAIAGEVYRRIVRPLLNKRI